MSASRRVQVGFTLQPEDDFLDAIEPLLAEVDYAEIAPETTWFVNGNRRRRNGYHGRFRRLAERHELGFVGHGVGFSLGDPGGDERRKRWLDWIAADHRAFAFEWYSDHLDATSMGQTAMALPIALPRDAPTTRRIATRLKALSEVVPVAGVETTVQYFAFDDPLSEPDWLNRWLSPARGKIVLDLHNVFTMAVNFGFQPEDWLEQLDLDRVIEIHVSGGAQTPPGWLPNGRRLRLDAHSDAIPEAVFSLLEAWAPRCRHLRGITLERMEGTVRDEDVATLKGELARIREIAQRVSTAPPPASPVSEQTLSPPPASTETTAAQYRTLAQLARVDDPLGALRDVGLHPRPADGVQVAAWLALRLRFERLVRGSKQAERWFDEDPRDFTEAFRAYHHAVPMRAFFPPDEASDFDAWLREASLEDRDET